ncbi:hypothetical protein PN36_16375 [Candidatus Thiomargarita nelsonii]|uniref:non-specific protein-tyrosine kinase n=1 Tax=Candidatus Thiomargarita nelsonii TaxID=1003181 RepID=A0A0A6PPD3_9GAMM|nr:hypothetical protein PN36_16375 [Candidatus Thiomargarita nelsonii]
MNKEEIKELGGQMTISEGSRVFIIPSEKEMAGDSVDIPQDEDKIAELLAYWHTFKKYKWRLIGLSLLVGFFTAIYSDGLEPSYSSTARLLIEFDRANIISIQDISATSSPKKDHFHTQLEILKSRILADKLVDKLNLVSHPAFKPASQQQRFDWSQWLPSGWLPSKKPTTESTPDPIETPEEKQKRIVVNAVRAGLGVSPVIPTQLVEISFESSDRELTAEIPNALAEIYIKYDLDTKLEMTNKAAKWLTERLENLRQVLEKSEKNMQDYMESQNLVNVTGIKSVTVRELEETATNLLNARLQLANNKRVYKQVRALQAGTTNFESIPAILNNSLVQSMKQAELAARRKVSELEERYGQKHPQIRAANAELEAAIANKKTQTQLVIDAIIKEYEMAVAKVKNLERGLKSKKAEIQSLNKKEFELKRLERDIEVNRQLYNMFLTRFKETNASQDLQELQSTVGRVVEPALPPIAPFKPNKKINVIMGLVLGFLFATVFVFVIEFLDNTIKTSEDVEQKLGLPLLGILPKMKISKKDENPYLMFLRKPQSQFAESVRSISTGIMLTGLDNPQKVLIVTSSVAGEGKSTVSINQAFALGQIGKTLLIEADMRRPSLVKKLGWRTNPPAPGLSELVAGRLQLDECIHHTAENESLDIIPCGEIPPNPLELFSSGRFKVLLEDLSKEYQYIVIDTPPVMLVSDTLVVAKFATEVLYVVKANVTPYKVVLDGLKRLRQVNVPVRNIVLNFVDTKKTSAYYGKSGYHGDGQHAYT